jgi:hypothetical protein
MMSPHKWRQFIEEVELRWQLEPGSLQQVTSANEIVTALHAGTGVSRDRADRDIQETMREFQDKVRRAA